MSSHYDDLMELWRDGHTITFDDVTLSTMVLSANQVSYNGDRLGSRVYHPAKNIMESNVTTIDDIRTAADLLKGQILRTPAINSPGLV